MNGLEAYLQAGLNLLGSLSWRQLGILYWYFFYLELPRYLVAGLLLLGRQLFGQRLENRGQRQRLLQNPPLVSVILPAYNEAASILPALTSLFRQSYPKLEIIVVDDGSTDGTAAVCQPLVRAGKIKCLRNELRGGKSSAANLGLYHSRGEYIITADADTVFDREAVWNIMLGFADSRVGAVSGNIRVRNAGQNLLTSLQAINYLITISIGRIISSWLNILLIVSGAFGAYRRELIEATGGWDVGPGEDADLTLKGRKWGAKIAFMPKAVCWTEVPASISGFIKQQLRWERSLVRCRLRKHRSFLCPFPGKGKFSSFLGTMDILFFQVLMAYSFVFYLGWLFMSYPYLAGFVLLSSYLLYLTANASQLFLAWGLSDYKRQDLKLFLYLPLYGLFNSYFLRFIRVWAYSEELLWRRSYRDSQVPLKVLEKTLRW